MRPAILSAVLLALACPAASGQETRGNRVFGQVVTIEVTDVADEIQRDEITRRVPQLMNPGEFVTRFSTGRGGVLIARVAPIPDVKAFAAKIDFGKVTNINGRTITVEARPVPGAGTAAASPLNRALVGLKSSSLDVRCAALKMLAEIEPDQRRREVVLALQGPLGGTESRAKALAIDALAVWGAKASVPTLLSLLNTRDGGPRRVAILALGRLEDPAAIEPIARRLADKSDQSEAVKALVAFGPAAEKAALRALAGKDSTARAGACEVLQKIGSRKSVAPLEAATRDSDTWVRSAATAALRSMKRRLR